MVKILGVCGSPRKAATHYSLTEALNAAARIEGVTTALIELRGKKINPCIGCNRCVKENFNGCLVYEDDMNELYRTFFDYDAYIIASPVYNMGVTGQLGCWFSRFRPHYLVQREDPDYNLYRLGAALTVGGTRNGGQETAINVIHGFYHTKGIPVVNGGLGIYAGASVWSQDRMAQGAAEDEKGMDNARAIGRRIAKLAVALKQGRGE